MFYKIYFQPVSLSGVCMCVCVYMYVFVVQLKEEASGDMPNSMLRVIEVYNMYACMYVGMNVCM